MALIAIEKSKSWNSQLNSTDNLANLVQFWGKWAGLAVLVAPKRLPGFWFFHLPLAPIIHCVWKPLRPMRAHFYHLIYQLYVVCLTFKFSSSAVMTELIEIKRWFKKDECLIIGYWKRSRDRTKNTIYTRDCCAKFATGLCIIVKSSFLLNFLTKFDYKHLK